MTSVLLIAWLYLGSVGKKTKTVSTTQPTKGNGYAICSTTNYTCTIPCTKRITFTVGISYFGQRIQVQFDDGKEYLGVIIGKDPQTLEWITKFEDGTEDKVADPATDEDYTLL